MSEAESPLVGPLISNLERFVRLSDEDRQSLRGLSSATRVQVEPRSMLIHEGDNPKVVRLMVSGWACRYKDLPDGRRQIVGLFVPGDFCDLNVYILQQMDHSIGALTAVEYLSIEPGRLEQLTMTHPRVGQALLWHELVNAAILREWLLNLGQRSALERLAHILLEIFVRLRAVGLVDGDTCRFPITQKELAEATGLTAVHVNRTLQELRRGGLVELSRRHLTIPDLERLMAVAMFNPNYLHLNHEGRYLDAR